MSDAARCPHCRTLSSLQPLDARYVAQLGGFTHHYLYCSDCHTISRQVRAIERYLGTAVLIPMLGVSMAAAAAGSYLWVALCMRASFPASFTLASFTLLNGSAFAVAMILRRLSMLHGREAIIPVGELRLD